jgi:4-methyl-5(b-hydroxyethyl)-thiazole monophosphate biosynthesis
MILGKLGLLNGKNAVCYPGFEKDLEGAIVSDKKAVADGRFITAKGMGAAIEFGLLLVEKLCGRETAESLRKSTISE